MTERLAYSSFADKAAAWFSDNFPGPFESFYWRFSSSTNSDHNENR